MERIRLALGIGAGEVRRFNLFHDESGFTSNDRYGVHGMLAVPDELVDLLGAELLRARVRHGYHNEIHFKDLGSSRWQQSPNWLVARDWVELLFKHFFTRVRFKAFAVDTKHEDFDRTRYPNPLSAYRRFFVTDAKSLVAWCLRGEGTLLLTPYTDAGNSLAQRRRRRDGTLFDSFGSYLERECNRERELSGKAFYPISIRVARLEPINSRPSKLTSQDADRLGLSLDQLRVRSDFIQLTDLVTSSLNVALTLSSKNEGKQHLAELVVDGFASWLDMPWDRTLPLRRRFSLSCFPGPGRTPYAVSLRGVRQEGIRFLQQHPEVARRLGPKTGVRPDAVGAQLDLGELMAAAHARELRQSEDHIEATRGADGRVW